jgi:hypothetical protein
MDFDLFNPPSLAELCGLSVVPTSVTPAAAPLPPQQVPGDDAPSPPKPVRQIKVELPEASSIDGFPFSLLAEGPPVSADVPWALSPDRPSVTPEANAPSLGIPRDPVPCGAKRPRSQSPETARSVRRTDSRIRGPPANPAANAPCVLLAGVDHQSTSSSSPLEGVVPVTSSPCPAVASSSSKAPEPSHDPQAIAVRQTARPTIAALKRKLRQVKCETQNTRDGEGEGGGAEATEKMLSGGKSGGKGRGKGRTAPGAGGGGDRRSR